MQKEGVIEDIKEFLKELSIFSRKSEVVYLLAEIRKLIEDDDEYKTLHFYCNWVLHGKLTHKLTLKILSSKFDFIELNKDKREIQKSLRHAEGGNFIKLNDFRSELHDFLRKKELPMKALEGDKWYKFAEIYLEIIKKCPIEKEYNKLKKSQVNNVQIKIKSLHLTKVENKYYFEFYLINGLRIDRIRLTYKKIKSKGKSHNENT